jgi:hypothetical protein
MLRPSNFDVDSRVPASTTGCDEGDERFIKEDAVKYLCLAYYDPKVWAGMSKAEIDALVSKCGPFDQSLQASGRMEMVASLGEPSAAASLRPKNGKTTMTDGPFVETKEQVGSFFIIEARDLNEAIQIASKHPAANIGEQAGWGVEVRAIEFCKYNQR